MRIGHALILLLILGAGACQEPTAPELAVQVERAQRITPADSADERWLENRLAGDWIFTRLLPGGKVEPNFAASIDGDAHRFKAFVFERIVIPRVAYQDHPCLRASKTLVGIEDHNQVFMLRGHDFSERLGRKPFCAWMSPQNADNYASSPTFWLERTGQRSALVGIAGSAGIVDLGATGKCDFLKVDSNPAYDIACEVHRYSATMDLQLGSAYDSRLPSIITSAGELVSAPQVVPGLRLTIHCTKETEMSFGGCELPSS